MDITKIDKNFAAKSVNGKEFEFYDSSYEKFKIYGLPFYDKERAFLRFPKEWYKNITNDGLTTLTNCLPGVRIRFKTNSTSLAIKANIRAPHTSQNMSSIGSSGFDVYIDENGKSIFSGKAAPNWNTDIVDMVINEKFDHKIKQFTVNFPLYNGVNTIEIGLSKGSIVEPPSEYDINKPILFYGSSITQGGCASRPGMAYPAILSRWLDADHINYGFSGSAKGEPEVAKIISNIDMSLFVMDYDYNANSIDHLRESHAPFFKIIRKAKPNLPIVFISKPDTDKDLNSKIRRNIIFDTYRNALNNGDKNVYFIDGAILFGEKDRDCCTIDGCHPNDLGFYRMAENIYPTLSTILLKGREHNRY